MCYHVRADPEAHWDFLLAAAHKPRGYTRLELIRAKYGEDIPGAMLYVSSGKPMALVISCRLTKALRIK